MRQLLLLFMIYIFPSCICAQPNTWKKSYAVKEGKQTRKYLKQANRYLKGQKYFYALMNANAALASKPKKKQRLMISEILPRAYENCLKEYHQVIDDYSASSRTINSDEQVNQRYEIFKKYTELARVQDLVQGMDAKIRKDLNVNPEEIDYEQKKKKASLSLEKGKAEVVEIHYQKAKTMMDTSAMRSSFRKAAKQAIKVYAYDKTYKDAEDLILSAYANGSSTCSVRYFYRSSLADVNRSTGFNIEKELFGYLTNKKNELPFINYLPSLHQSSGSAPGMNIDEHNILVDKNNEERDKGGLADYRIEGTILNYDIIKDVIYGEKYKDKKNIKPGGKTSKGDLIIIPVAAEIQPITNKAMVKIEVAVQVINNRNGAILFSQETGGTYEWTHRWAKLTSGDKRALSSTSKSLLERGNADFPSDLTINKNASKPLANRLGKLLVSTLQKNKF